MAAMKLDRNQWAIDYLATMSFLNDRVAELEKAIVEFVLADDTEALLSARGELFAFIALRNWVDGKPFHSQTSERVCTSTVKSKSTTIPKEVYKLLLQLAQLAIDEATFTSNSGRKDKIRSLGTQLQKWDSELDLHPIQFYGECAVSSSNVNIPLNTFAK